MKIMEKDIDFYTQETIDEFIYYFFIHTADMFIGEAIGFKYFNNRASETAYEEEYTGFQQEIRQYICQNRLWEYYFGLYKKDTGDYQDWVADTAILNGIDILEWRKHQERIVDIYFKYLKN